MKKKLLFGIIITLVLAVVSILTVYYLRTKRQVTQKKAAGEFKTFIFKPADNSYEAVFSYKWEYPKFIWRFDKLTCAVGKTLGQRRFLHVGQTEEEVQKGGWLDQSYIPWNPGDPLPSGEITVPQDRGCWFQLDMAMTIKPQYGQTVDETSGTSRSERAVIDGCGQLPTPTSTGIPPTATPILPTATPTHPAVLTATPTGTPPSPTPTAVNPSLTPTTTPVVPTITPIPTATVLPTSTPPVPTTTLIPGQSYCNYLQADKTSGAIPLTINFRGNGVDTTRVKGFRFSFGDGEKWETLGSYTSSHVQEASHNYTKAGTYIAVLEILDNGDRWRTRDECRSTIIVSTRQLPSPTSPPVATSTPRLIAKAPTPTEVILPKAGIEFPTLGSILTGLLLISIGLMVIF